MKTYLLISALITYALIVSCKKDNTTNPELVSGPTVTDIDGNLYHSVIIGTQTWMAENLKTTHYNNGDAIPNVTDTATWNHFTTGAYCNYDNNSSYAAAYGHLYNWYVVNSNNVCPSGWHVPTDTDWATLVNYLGGENVAGGKLKETGTTHWISPNTGATNETGFTALPSGTRTIIGTFLFIGFNSQWWQSTEYNTNNAYTMNVSYDQAFIGHSDFSKKSGFSVRCIKDAENGK